MKRGILEFLDKAFLSPPENLLQDGGIDPPKPHL